MEAQLHTLCELCQRISFSLHENGECKSLGCNYAKSDPMFGGVPPHRPFNRESLEAHSLPNFHHNAFEALKISAQTGCHLCTLLAFALEHSNGSLSTYDAKKHPYSQSSVITLIYHKSSKWTHKEELEVFCGPQFSALPVTNLLPSKCSDRPFLGNIWPSQGVERRYFADADTLFYARCIAGKHPFILPPNQTGTGRLGLQVIDGFIQLINYLPGQIMNVYRENGERWLASFVYGIPAALPAHHAQHPMFGWVDRQDFVRLSQPVHPCCDCGKGVWEPPLIGMVGGGQTSYIAKDPASETVFSRIKTWFSSCVAYHDVCRPPTSARLPLRVLDVGLPNSDTCYLRVNLDKQDQYATLSYRWGSSPTLITTQSHLSSRIAGISFKSLPRTMQDAVIVTRKLGLRYLWIDAVCIVQDSDEDWEEQSSKMGQIYTDACLNISVGSASDTCSGFLGERNLLQLRSCKHPTLMNGTNQLTKVICPSIPRPDRFLNRDILNTRGWILQERALSRRTINFGPYEVYWECLAHSATEREPEDFRHANSSSFDDESQRRREDWLVIRNSLHFLQNQSAKGLLDKLGDQWLRMPKDIEDRREWILRNLEGRPRRVGQISILGSSLERVSENRPSPRSPESNRFLAAHHLWYLLVEDYSLRFLTRATDKLPALSGLAKIFCTEFGRKSEYLAGIWTGDILNGLSWRRSRFGGSGSESLPIPAEPRTYRAPSFSWASVDIPIYFEAERAAPAVQIRSSYEARLLFAKATSLSSDPLGKVSNAWIKLQAYITLFRNIKGRYGEYSAPIFDHDGVDDSDPRLICASIRSRVYSSAYEKSSNQELKDCLMLVPSDSGKEYRRIGWWRTRISLPPPPGYLGDPNPVIRAALAELERLGPISDSPPIDQSLVGYEGWGWEKVEITII